MINEPVSVGTLSGTRVASDAARILGLGRASSSSLDKRYVDRRDLMGSSESAIRPKDSAQDKKQSALQRVDTVRAGSGRKCRLSFVSHGAPLEPIPTVIHSKVDHLDDQMGRKGRLTTSVPQSAS